MFFQIILLSQLIKIVKRFSKLKNNHGLYWNSYTFTPLLEEKLQEAARKICEIEGEDVVLIRAAQKWFKKEEIE